MQQTSLIFITSIYQSIEIEVLKTSFTESERSANFKSPFDNAGKGLLDSGIRLVEAIIQNL